MARMIPQQIDDSAPYGEKTVFEALRTQLTDDFTVLHSQRYFFESKDARPPRQGECDFIILTPDRGVLDLEVKGGTIRRDTSGTWTTTNQRGTAEIGHPGKQAEKNIRAIVTVLKKHRHLSGRNTNIRFGWCTCLPDSEVTRDLGPDLPRNLIIDRNDLRDLPTALERAFSAHGMKPGEGTRISQSVFLESLAPEVDLAPTLASRLDDDLPVLVRLTDEQLSILGMMARMTRLAVRGAAGTGKTLVAMEKARRMAAEGSRVLLLCYNRHLATELASSADGFVAKSFHAYCRETVRHAGLPFDPPRGPNQQAFWDDEVPQILSDALDLLPDERWDAVIVDEGQDFKELWWLPIEKLVRDEPAGCLWVFHDPAQNIYGGGPAEALGLQEFDLTYNCRNTEKIARYANAFVGQDPIMKPCAPEGVDVVELEAPDDGDIYEAVRELVTELTGTQNIRSDRILLLSPRAKERSTLWRNGRIGRFQLVEYPTRPGEGEIAFSSLSGFKGLDRDVVILAEVREGEFTTSDRHMYVGTSRAKLALYVIRYA